VPPESSSLPPAYVSGQITDPRLEEVARDFTAWTNEQRAGKEPVFARIEVLRPVETLLPYGFGTYQKELRVPAVLTVAADWSKLKPGEREGLITRAFQDLSGRLAALKSAPLLRPTLTVQTLRGLQLGWINDLQPGRMLVHGDDE
jgi:hypothetical protein